MFKVVMKVGDVPIGSIVTKPTGTYRFRVKEEIRIQGLAPIVASNGTRILMGLDSEGSECVPIDREVLWVVEAEKLRDWLSDILDDDK